MDAMRVQVATAASSWASPWCLSLQQAKALPPQSFLSRRPCAMTASRPHLTWQVLAAAHKGVWPLRVRSSAAGAAVCLCGREHRAFAAHCAGGRRGRVIMGLAAAQEGRGAVKSGELVRSKLQQGCKQGVHAHAGQRSETQEVTVASAPGQGSALGSHASSRRTGVHGMVHRMVRHGAWHGAWHGAAHAVQHTL